MCLHIICITPKRHVLKVNCHGLPKYFYLAFTNYFVGLYLSFSKNRHSFEQLFFLTQPTACIPLHAEYFHLQTAYFLLQTEKFHRVLHIFQCKLHIFQYTLNIFHYKRHITGFEFMVNMQFRIAILKTYVCNDN